MSGKGAPIALVHHANQYLITDGYEDRQGISQVLDGYAEVLSLHEKHNLPASFHLSGTLIEAAAWQRPQFLEYVRGLLTSGLLSPIGGTYAENVMTLFSAEFNRRQLQELFWLYERHLGVRPSSLATCWVPERVWDTDLLSPVLTDPGLANGGYRYVFLDDRLAYPVGERYEGSERARFDSAGPYPAHAGEGRSREASSNTASRPYRIEGGRGLTMLPISSNLRYWIPPSSADDWRRLEEAASAAIEPGAIMIYSDDLEKTAGVGGWGGAAPLKRYEEFLRWLESRQDIDVVRLEEWLGASPEPETRRIERGCFFELAQGWDAGEDYSGWWDDPAWAVSGSYLERCLDAVRKAEGETDGDALTELAWKHLLASSYETAWHDDEGGAVAGWARALASQARASLTIAAAARHFAQDGLEPIAKLLDMNEDGAPEVILSNDHLLAVINPGGGARVVHLYVRTKEGGALVVGNPSDDWNLLDAPDRYMDRPANHPGALADARFEHDRYEVSSLGVEGGRPYAELTNVQEGSPLAGARKTMTLLPKASALLACYRLPERRPALDVGVCFSPDYYRLLREGRASLRPFEGEGWRGYQNGDVAVWLALADDEPSAWVEPRAPEAGHGLNLSARARSSHFHLLIGCGPTDAETCRSLLREGRVRAHRRASEISGAARSGA